MGGGGTLRDVRGLALGGLGSGACLDPPCARVPTGPVHRGQQEPHGLWALETEPKQGQGAGEQVCTLDLGWEWSGEQKEFHSIDPHCWGAPGLEWEQVSVLKKGWGK